MDTLDGLERKFKDGKEVLSKVRSEIRGAQANVTKQKEALLTIEATKKYAIEQLAFLRSTKKCVIFLEYKNLKEMAIVNLELYKNATSELLKHERLIAAAKATVALVEANLRSVKKQIEEFDNLFLLEDFQDDDN